MTSLGLGIVGLFSKKIKFFVDGRKDVFETLQKKIAPTDKTIWFHCASLGEYEQGVPIIKEVRKLKPDHKIVVSFFSPSGYEVKKNTKLAEITIYLPMDTITNAKKFIDIVHPSLAFFIKYEFWPNYLYELKKREVPVLLISGVFQKNQLFFRDYGGFMRKALTAFQYFFVQDENSKELLESIGFNNVTVSGDTRFDRVSNQTKIDNILKFADDFKGNSLCIVCGSTWPEDEAVLLEYINSAPDTVKFIIAPHKIEADKINNLREKINNKTVLHSESDDVDLSEYSVLIIDCIGLLGKLYSYADIAYVGGAAGRTGLHNILEPVTFGVPIIIGKNHVGFPEAQRLKDLKGLFTVENSDDAKNIFNNLVENADLRLKSGIVSGKFVQRNTGATSKILEYIETNME